MIGSWGVLRGLGFLVGLVLAFGVVQVERGVAAVGDLGYLGCLSGDEAVGPSGTDACDLIGSATFFGDGSGLGGASSVATSPDGKNVYAGADLDSAVAAFGRDGTGALSFAGCISGSNAAGSCTKLGSATVNGLGSGLAGAKVAISPDGKNVYAISNFDDSIATFDRNTNSGSLSFGGCITGDSSLGPCSKLGGGRAQPGASGSPLQAPRDLALSPDGKSLYVAASEAHSVTVFDRDPGSGDLSFASCQTGDASVTGCTAVPGATDPDFSGLDGAAAVAVNPTGGSVYVAGSFDDAITSFTRAADGSLTHTGCVSGDSGAGPGDGSPVCTLIPSHQPNGTASGLNDPIGLAVSPDGQSVYAIASDDSAVTGFSSGAGGALAFQNCVTGNSDVGACAKVPGAMPNGFDTPLAAPTGIVATPDGTSVLTTSSNGAALTRFERSAAGALSFNSCLSGNDNVTIVISACTPLPGATAAGLDSGLDQLSGLAVGADGKSVYAASFGDHGLAGFTRQAGAIIDPGDDGDDGDDGAGALKLRLSGSKKQSSPKLVKVKARCTRACAVAVKAKGGALKLAPAKADLEADETRTLKLKFKGSKTKKKVKRALRGSKPLKLTLAGKATAGAETAKATFKLKIKA